jgi:hypothetical protein
MAYGPTATRNSTNFTRDCVFGALTCVCLGALLTTARLTAASLDIESELHRYILTQLHNRTSSGQEDSPPLGDIFGETIESLETNPEMVLPSLRHHRWIKTGNQRPAAALRYVRALRQELATLELKKGKPLKGDPNSSERRPLAVNVTFLDISDIQS